MGEVKGDFHYEGEGAEKLGKPVCTATKCQCIIVVVVFVALVAVIAVLAGLLATKESKEAVSPTTPLPASQPWDDHRLPTYILPHHYDLTLFPDFYDGHDTFTGNVTIWLNVTMPTRYLLVHIRDLTVTQTVLRRGDVVLTIAQTFHHEENEYWVIEASDVIMEGQVDVTIAFGGSLVNGIVGLYRSVYVNTLTNEESYIATSKFQPTDARKAFPCLDEPGLKSTFTTTLIHKDGMVPLSNMPIETTTSLADGFVETRFQKSVPMVTYLKCFIVCDFEYKEIMTAGNKTFRVYATPDKINQTDYALDIGVRILDYFESYYGLPYPLPKMDMIAIPDFVSGAMEHWGLITYRETNLLYDEMDASLTNKQRVAVVVAHELAHMWFGNLVTMEWWDDLWLNEGFASYVEYIGVNHVESEWDMGAVFVPSDLQRVMPDDSKISSHPIIVPVDHPSEITEVFDSISYSKGASVLRMLDAFMGTVKFKSGLQQYMKDYEFKTTVTDDLWAALEKVDGTPIKAIMDTWTRQMGFPVVNVRVKGSNQVTLTQERFLLDPAADKTEPPSDFNIMPCIMSLVHVSALVLRTRSDTGTNGASQYGTKPMKKLILHYTGWITQKHFFNDMNMKLLELLYTTVTITTSTDLSTGWIKLNLDQLCYYRVNYEDSMWQRLVDTLMADHEALSASDRSGLIDDAFNLASAGLVDISQALDLIQYMTAEYHLVPWRTVSSRLNFITEMMVTGIHFEKWQTVVRNLTTDVLKNITYQDAGTDLERQMRGYLIGLSCGHGHAECLEEMENMFSKRLGGEQISPNIRSSVYKYGMQRIGDEKNWDFMWGEYSTAVVPQEKNRLLYAVTQTREPWLIHRLLGYSMDSSYIRDQDFFTMISYLTRNRVAHPIVWNFAQANWLQLVDRFDIGNRYLGRMVPGITNYFNTQSQLKEVENFFAEYPEAGAGARAREQAIEQIHNNIAWMEANEQPIIDWLNTP